MKSAALALTLLVTAFAGAAEAKGCLGGAVVGGVAGHFAHHHTLAGAAAGCVAGHYIAHAHDKKLTQARARHDHH